MKNRQTLVEYLESRWGAEYEFTDEKKGFIVLSREGKHDLKFDIEAVKEGYARYKKGQ